MQINSDLSKRAAEDSGALPWVPSPVPGVERRMLERDGDEVARLTSVVRYAPNSHFTGHTHSGGEEYLVLEGTFSDDYGDFPAGTYVRNPVGSKHAPHSDNGAVILVKLWWMHKEDQEYVRIDTTNEELWRPTGLACVEAIYLHSYQDESTAMYRLAAGARLPARDLPGGEELFVFEGSCRDDNGTYGKGSWIRAPVGDTAPALYCDGGCRILVKRGHLLDAPPGPNAV